MTVSDCCGAEVEVKGKTTNYYVCTDCGDHCNGLEEPPQYTVPGHDEVMGAFDRMLASANKVISNLKGGR